MLYEVITLLPPETAWFGLNAKKPANISLQAFFSNEKRDGRLLLLTEQELLPEQLLQSELLQQEQLRQSERNNFV